MRRATAFLVMAWLVGISGTASFAQHEQTASARTPLVGELPQSHDLSDIPWLKSPAQRGPDDLWTAPPTASGIGLSREHFLGMGWLLVPNAAADDGVFVEHPLQSSKRIAPSLVLLGLESNGQNPATQSALGTILDDDDVSLVGAARIRF